MQPPSLFHLMVTIVLHRDRCLMAPIRDDPDRVCDRAAQTKRKQRQIKVISIFCPTRQLNQPYSEPTAQPVPPQDIRYSKEFRGRSVNNL